MLYVIIYLSKPTECTIPRVNPNVNYGIWVIMTSMQAHATLMEFEGGNTCMETGSTWGASVPSSQFWN